ncbi:MAG: hypothetical protein B5M51_06910 [Anaerolinea sp. 4484_236]|nr:MAG: hypothetical protein B5M51_06910 [Anaerolinea sp. 4484_236]
MRITKHILQTGLLLSLAFFLVACGGETAPEPTPIDPVAIFTEAAQTVAAQMTETAMAFSPTPPPPTPTLPQPTATLIDLGTTIPINTPPTVGTPPTLLPGAPTLIPSPTQLVILPTPEGPICDDMTYGSPLDITIPDGSTVKAGHDFEKIWRVYNTGVCTWDEGYKLIPIASSSTRPDDKNPLDAPNPAWEIKKTSSVNKFVEPGGVVDIGVKLTAPVHIGEYSTCFIMENDRGVYFGGVLCVEIVVKGD